MSMSKHLVYKMLRKLMVLYTITVIICKAISQWQHMSPSSNVVVIHKINIKSQRNALYPSVAHQNPQSVSMINIAASLKVLFSDV